MLRRKIGYRGLIVSDDLEMGGVQAAQPTPEARRGVAEFPRQIRRARPMLERLANEAPRTLADKPLELVWATVTLPVRLLRHV